MDIKEIVIGCIDGLNEIHDLYGKYEQYDAIKKLVIVSGFFGSALISLLSQSPDVAILSLSLAKISLDAVKQEIASIENVIEQSKGKPS